MLQWRLKTRWLSLLCQMDCIYCITTIMSCSHLICLQPIYGFTKCSHSDYVPNIYFLCVMCALSIKFKWYAVAYVTLRLWSIGFAHCQMHTLWTIPHISSAAVSNNGMINTLVMEYCTCISAAIEHSKLTEKKMKMNMRTWKDFCLSVLWRFFGFKSLDVDKTETRGEL